MTEASSVAGALIKSSPHLIRLTLSLMDVRYFGKAGKEGERSLSCEELKNDVLYALRRGTFSIWVFLYFALPLLLYISGCILHPICQLYYSVFSARSQSSF